MATHAEKRVLHHSPEQLFDLVADVERYPLFLPWCIGARIRSRRENVVVADLIIGFKGIREKFTSEVTLDRPGMRVDVAYRDGPFKYLNNHWIDFEFRSRLLQKVIGLLFNEAVRRMVSAFEARADQLYGRN
jgi:coenzyme Q-binding protein COQ10